jgi:soluble lytic murein transglycosylase
LENRLVRIIKSFIILLLVFVSLTLLFFIYQRVYTFYFESKYPLNYRETIEKYSNQFQIESSFTSAVIYEESRFRPNSSSEKGAIGLMQLLPETANYIAKKTDDTSFKIEDLIQAEKNIQYGCYYLNYLFVKYQDWDKVLAAYNAGEGNVDQWLNEGDYQIKFNETRNFVERVKNSQEIYKKLYFKNQ